MPSPTDPKFSWRGVVLIAIGFMLVGLAIVLRGPTGPAPTSYADWKLTLHYLAPILRFVAGSAMIAAIALLGGWFAYLRGISRLRTEQRKLEDERAATRKA